MVERLCSFLEDHISFKSAIISTPPQREFANNKMLYLWAALYIVTIFAGWAITALAMPGTWVIVGATAIYWWGIDATDRMAVGTHTLIALVILAIIGEIVEFAASAAGVKRAGGSKRGAVLAIVGSLCGALLGLVVGVPIPIIGSLIGAIVFGGLGAMAGAFIGEQWKHGQVGQSWNVGRAAFWGRLLGTVGKLGVATVMFVIAMAALLIQ